MITLFYLVAFYPRRTVVNSIGGADNRIQLVRGVPRSRRDDARDDCGRPQMNFTVSDPVQGTPNFQIVQSDVNSKLIRLSYAPLNLGRRYQ